MGTFPSPTFVATALTAAGTSGQYDGKISVVGGGTQPGHGAASYTAAQHNMKAYDGSIQFSVGLQPASVAYWQAQGGVTNAIGASLFATNGTPLSGNVDGNFIAQNNGNLWFGTGSGQGLKIADPGAPGTNNLTITAGTASTNPKLSSTGITQVDGTILSLSAGGVQQATIENANSLTATGNYVQIFGASTGNQPGIRAKGDTNCSLWLRPSGTGGLSVVTDQGEIFKVSNSSFNTLVGDLNVRAGSSTVPVLLQANGNNIAMGGNNGGGAQLPTASTTGFAGIPTIAAAPTGVPQSGAGAYAYIVVNTTSHNLNIWDPIAAAWYHVALTVGAA